MVEGSLIFLPGMLLRSSRVWLCSSGCAGLVAVSVLAAAAGLDRLGLAGISASIMWTLTLASVLVLPWYMVLLGLVQLRLKRSAHPDDRVGLFHSRLMTSLGTAPTVAGVLALACGILLH
jgi:hypothetical protein